MPPRFPQHDALPPVVEKAIERMMAQQEPYPLLVFGPAYEILRFNHGAERLVSALVGRELADEENLYALLFDPCGLRAAVIDWELLARSMIARLHREALVEAHDARYAALLERVLAYPGVPSAWAKPDLSMRLAPTLELSLRWRDRVLSFLTTVTVFSAPQEIAIAETRIESFFPLDDTTRDACEELAR